MVKNLSSCSGTVAQTQVNASRENGSMKFFSFLFVLNVNVSVNPLVPGVQQKVTHT